MVHVLGSGEQVAEPTQACSDIGGRFYKTPGLSWDPRTEMLLGAQEWRVSGMGVFWGAQEVPDLLSLFFPNICFILNL